MIEEKEYKAQDNSVLGGAADFGKVDNGGYKERCYSLTGLNGIIWRELRSI